MEPRVSTATGGTDHENIPHTSTSSTSNTIRLSLPPSPLALLDSPTSHNLPGGLEKLQTYLPTGTWVMYAALQTWALTLRPNDPPISPDSSCNIAQRAALFFAVIFASLFAFVSSFVKRFVYNADGSHVMYPLPDMFNVSRAMVDPVTHLRFPCETTARRYCWPFIDAAGELVHDDQQRLRVLVFKLGVPIHVDRQPLHKRVWKVLFHVNEGSEVSPASKISRSDRKPPLLSRPVISEGALDTTIDVGDLFACPPPLEPRWKYTFMASNGSKAYVDLQLSVWEHATVSLLAFIALALFSTQVRTCLYPSLPEYVSSIVQTSMLAVLSTITTLFIGDNAVSLGQTPPQIVKHPLVPSPTPAGQPHENNTVPDYLAAVVEMVVWIKTPNIA